MAGRRSVTAWLTELPYKVRQHQSKLFLVLGAIFVTVQHQRLQVFELTASEVRFNRLREAVRERERIADEQDQFVENMVLRLPEFLDAAKADAAAAMATTTSSECKGSKAKWNRSSKHKASLGSCCCGSRRS